MLSLELVLEVGSLSFGYGSRNLGHIARDLYRVWLRVYGLGEVRVW